VAHAPWEAILPALAPQSVDHVISDAPYSAQTHDGARTLWRKGARWRTPGKQEAASRIAIDFDPLEDVRWFLEGLRVARRWCMSFCEVEQLGEYRAAAGESWIRGGIWYRTDGTPQLSGDRPAQGAEGIAIAHGPERARWNCGGRRGVWVYGVEREDRRHPTQKPLALMLDLVESFTDPDDVVADPFMGSATTGAACYRLGRRFIGIERDAEHFATARARMMAETAGVPLRATTENAVGQLPLLAGV
jgi:site-specific DNA-methyltransferase (adenine-specific)